MKLNKNQIDALNIELALTVEKADYEEKERKRLASYRKNAEFKGFRKGNVPASLIKKFYGDQALAESVNEVISEGLQKFIDDEKLRLLGEPIPSEKQPEIEWVDGKDFDFLFDLGIYPEVKVEAGKDDVVNKYSITLSDKDKAPMVDGLKKYYEEQKQEKTDEEIDKEVTERLKGQYENEAEWRLSRDIRDYFVEKAKVELPEDFLKRWLVYANDGKISKEDVEKDFEGFLKDFRWQLVRDAFMKNYDLKVEKEDLEKEARGLVAYQYAMYGMANVPEDILNQQAQEVLSDRKQLDRVLEQVEDRKVLEKLRSEITTKSKRISAEKFRELK